jgi:hypothetical protein
MILSAPAMDASTRRYVDALSSSGSGHYWVEGYVLSDEDWAKRRSVAIRLLSKRGKPVAAKLLETSGFEMRVGGNDFGDEFSVLYRAVGLDDYVVYESFPRSRMGRTANHA